MQQFFIWLLAAVRFPQRKHGPYETVFRIDRLLNRLTHSVPCLIHRRTPPPPELTPSPLIRIRYIPKLEVRSRVANLDFIAFEEWLKSPAILFFHAGFCSPEVSDQDTRIEMLPAIACSRQAMRHLAIVPVQKRRSLDFTMTTSLATWLRDRSGLQ